MNPTTRRIFGTVATAATLAACGGGASVHTEAQSGTYSTTSGGSGGGEIASGPSYPSATVSAPARATGEGYRGPSDDMAMEAPPPPAPGTTTTVTVTTATSPLSPPMQQTWAQQQVVPAAGRLTAASVGDSDRRDNYLGYLARHFDERDTLGLDMTRRVRLRILDAQNRPVNNAQIDLAGEGVRVSARTHADGVWDFYPGVASPQSFGALNASVRFGQFATRVRVDAPTQGDGQDIVVQLPFVQTMGPRALDLAFAIDVTGSMGDELRYVNHEIADIVHRIEAATPGTTVRVGATFYRDRVDPQLVQQIPFTQNVSGFAAAMQSIHASGGGDYPEDMNAGLEAAMTRLDWSQDLGAVKILVVIADAPPQMYDDEQYTFRTAMVDASQRGIRILPVAASGANRTVEYLFRAMGAMTSTPYVYLTDDSGIGSPHMEADTDRVAVERFNQLLVRVVTADLQGLGMHEPGPLGPTG